MQEKSLLWDTEFIYPIMIKILYPGRIAPIKDIPTLEKAAKIVGAKLIINNTYSYNDIPKLFKTADIIVVPTFSKALDKVFLEGLACGITTIGTNIGYPFMIKKSPQLIFKAGNPEDLAQKIKWLIDNPKEARKITSKAREFVYKNFDLEKLMDKIVDMFTSVR